MQQTKVFLTVIAESIYLKFLEDYHLCVFTPSSFVDLYQLLRQVCGSQNQSNISTRLHDVTSQKVMPFTITVVGYFNYKFTT